MRRFVPAILMAAVACGGSAPVPPVVRDSAGVTIVENFGPSWTGDGAWTLSENPTLSIGETTRGEQYGFERIRGALRLSDGKIVVANGGTHELRWYSGTGEHLSTAGGARGGVSFSNLDWIGRYGDASVIAFDGMNLRTSVFGGDGSLIRSTSLVMTFQAPPGAVRGVFADSSLLVVRGARHWVRAMQGQPDPPEGLRRGPTLAFRYSSDDGTFLNPLGTFPGSEQIFRTGRTQIVHVAARPFGRNAVLATAGNSFYVGTQDAFELRVFNSSDSLTGLIRLDRENAPVTQEDIDRYKNARLANVHSRERAAREAQLDSLPFPDE